MTETQQNWIDLEAKELEAKNTEMLPYYKFEENKLANLEIDASKPFEKRIGQDGKTQACIQIVSDGKKYLWTLNIVNPIYHELIVRLKAGTRQFSILRTGKMKETRFTIVK